MWLVGRGEGSEFVRRQFKFCSLDCILNVMGFGGADDWSGDSGLVENPGERNLGVCDASFFGDLDHSFHNLEIVLFVVQTMSKFVGFRADRFAFVLCSAISGEKPTSQRAPRN